jgi:hypothetical protein
MDGSEMPVSTKAFVHVVCIETEITWGKKKCNFFVVAHAGQNVAHLFCCGVGVEARI